MPLTFPEPGRSALLLDIDGTLLDLAPTPDSVIVPPDLVDTLWRLRGHLGGALAVVTGRPLEQADALLGGAPFAVAGEHGGAIRHHPDGAIERASLPDLPAGWREAAEALAAMHAGALVEEKRRGLVLHYRLAPDAGPALHEAVLALVAPDAERFQVLQASMAWEVRPRGVDKGVAVDRLCQAPPFAGRLPIFIGDDVTDEDGIRAAQRLGGVGLRVEDAFATPQGVRDWLRRNADGFDAGNAAWQP